MSLKRQIRYFVDHGARMTGLLARWERGMRAGLTTLMYHRVLPAEHAASYPFPSLVMERDAFRRQAEWLAAHADVLPLGAALDLLEREPGPRDRPLVSITFDDGYDDNFEHAAPLLEDAGLRATFFATCDFVATGEKLWFDRAAELLLKISGVLRVEIAARAGRGAGLSAPPVEGDLGEWMEYLKRLEPSARDALLERYAEQAGAAVDDGRCAPMSVDELRGLSERGHEIGSHTLSHPILTQLDDAELATELVRSREQLEAWLDTPVVGLAYPNGDGDPRVEQAARDAGYRWACTTLPGRQSQAQNRFAVPRFDMAPHHVASPSGRFDTVAFRAELSAFHHRFRKGA